MSINPTNLKFLKEEYSHATLETFCQNAKENKPISINIEPLYQKLNFGFWTGIVIKQHLFCKFDLPLLFSP
ncbi:MAG: hypothetical protein WCP39_06505, partial [Chlamydiota bacterium]